MKSNKALKLIFLLSMLVIIFLVSAKSQGWISSDSVRKVTTQKPQRRTIVHTVPGNGKLQSSLEVKVSSDISGEIVELYVKQGDKVQQGDLLLKLKSDVFQAARQRSEAQVNMAKATMAEANSRLMQAKARFVYKQKDFKRSEMIYQAHVISTAEFEKAKADFEIANEEVNAAEAGVRNALHQLEGAEAALQETENMFKRSEIYAPAGGTVSMLNVRKGEHVLGTSRMEGTELLRIYDPSRMEVCLDVNESDILNVTLNDEAEIEVSAYPGIIFKGVVSSISNNVKVDMLNAEQLTNFEVKVSFLPEAYAAAGDNIGDSPFLSGMTASVKIKAQQAQNTFCVPKDAIIMHEEMDNAVFVLEKGIAKLREVETGIEDKSFVQVSGLSEKQEIITGPSVILTKLLKEGDRVERER